MLNKTMIAIFTLLVGFSTLVQAGGATPPFLIMKKMPHLTKMVKMKWNDEFLELTDAQKKKLLVVRKNTMAQTAKIKKALAPLEKNIASKVMAGAKASELMSMVKEVAVLKTEATKVHIECIYQTKKILSAEQLQHLLEYQ